MSPRLPLVNDSHVEQRRIARVFAVMTDDKLYDEATEVTARDGEVVLDGPDGVDVKVTPEAAEQTADNLIQEAVKARGQRRLKDFPHRPH
ncbi:MAG: hypothetical protein ABI770_07070 [Sphingomicrobium sp.]